MSEVNYSANEQIRHSSQSDFVSDLNSVWTNVAKVSDNNAQLIIRFGKISDRDVNPVEIIKESLVDTGWKCVTIKSAGSAAKGYRQAKHMIKNASAASEEFDIWVRLG
jgi:hypothetical protein